MDLNQLKEFIAIARIGNYQRAAEHLFISQSSLSKHIKSMEKELGSMLFDRSKRKCELTDFGRAFLPYAVEINDCRQRYTLELLSHMDTDQRSVSIGFASSSVVDMMSNVVHHFRNENLNCSLKVSQGNYDTLIEMLRKREYTFIIVPELKDVSSDEFHMIRSNDDDEIVAVLPTSHPLANEKVIPVEKLKDEIFIRIGTSFVEIVCAKLCREAGFEPRIDFTVRKSETIIKLIENGMGISLLLKSVAQQHATPRISIVDISPKVHINTVLMYSKDRPLLPEEAWVENYFRSMWSR